MSTASSPLKALQASSGVVAVRSLADHLRSRSTGSLVELLRARPDLAVPLAPDMATLAARATTRAGVARALDRLDVPQLQVLEVLAALDEPADPGSVSLAWGADATEVIAGLEHLALVWSGEGGLRMVRMARDLLGPYPAGLGPPLREALDRRSPAALAQLGERLGVPASGDPDTTIRRIADLLRDPDRIAELLRDAPPEAERILARLTPGPPVGEVGAVAGATAQAVTWLLRHGLLAAAEDGRVVLPREAGLALRAGRVHADPRTSPPDHGGAQRPVRSVDLAAGGAAAEAVRLVSQLLASVERSRVPVLRTGGLGVRELRRLAGELRVDETTAARVAETAYGTGLIMDDEEGDPSFVVTTDGEDWLGQDAPVRWAALASSWVTSVRVAALSGSRDAAGTVRAALSEAVERPASVELRGQLLDLLAMLPPGTAVDLAGLTARLTFLAPRRATPARDTLVEALLDDAAWLGLTGAGALSTPGRALLGDGAAAAAAAMRGLLPEPVDHIVLQADLTAVAPGPLVGWLDTEMALAADVESRGAATVYRFSADSVRRALDAGRDAEALLDTLERASTAGVPQPLAYLVRDVARRHGAIRIGLAGTYVRSDDENALSELLADRRAAPLGLRRLAPTVLLSSADPAALLKVLRSLGAAPVVDSEGGAPTGSAAGVNRSQVRRVSRRRATRAPDALPDETALREAVARWRVTESGPKPGSAGLPRMEPAVSLSVLRDAIGTGGRVWIGYVDETGRATQRLIVPRSLEAGRLTAEEVGRAGPRLFSVHRVTGAVLDSVED